VPGLIPGQAMLRSARGKVQVVRGRPVALSNLLANALVRRVDQGPHQWLVKGRANEPVTLGNADNRPVNVPRQTRISTLHQLAAQDSLRREGTDPGFGRGFWCGVLVRVRWVGPGIRGRHAWRRLCDALTW